jgi:hypothetical protein
MISVRLKMLNLQRISSNAHFDTKSLSCNYAWTCVLQLLQIRPSGCSNSELISETVSPFTHLVGLPWRGIGQSQGLDLQRTAQHRKRGYISMPRVGFAHRIPMFEGSVTVYALDRAATVNSWFVHLHFSSLLGIFNTVAWAKNTWAHPCLSGAVFIR